MTERGEKRLSDLYVRHAPDAIRLAYLLTGKQHTAEDIVQDAFVRLFGRFRDLRNPDAFQAYLRKTVINISRDHFRRLRSERALAARESPRHESSQIPELEEWHSLYEALRSLPHRQRAALILRYAEELSERETAEAMGCSVAAVKSLVSRATGRLRMDLRREVR